MEQNEVENKVENEVVKKERPQNKHLKPHVKGENGGAHRPLGQKNYSTLYREALIKLAKLNDKEPAELELDIISKGILNARGGDFRFYKDVLDRLLGQAMQKQETEHKGITQFNINILTPEQIADIKKEQESAKIKENGNYNGHEDKLEHDGEASGGVSISTGQ